MGLLLSILVTCVGVVELLTFYQNVRRRVNYQPIESSLATVHHSHFKQLETIRDKLENQLVELNKNPQSAKLPTFRLNSHEDIEVEFSNRVVARSRSSSPRRFLVSEKKHEDAASTRQFVVLEEPQGIQKSKAQECLPEYLIEEEPREDVLRYVLKDENGPVPLPLPEKFVVSEHNGTAEVKTDVFRKKLGHTVVEVDGELYFRRSPSPFPSFDLTAPRNSVCSELLDDCAEVDEPSRSNSGSPVNANLAFEAANCSEKVNVLLDSSRVAHCSTEYWEAKALIVPPRKSKSRSPSPGIPKLSKQPAHLERRRISLSESRVVNLSADGPAVQRAASSLELSKEGERSSDEDEAEAEGRCPEDTGNNLEDVDTQKGCIKKKSVKRKRNKNRRKLDSMQLDAATELSSTRNTNEDSGGPKLGEPFWLIFSGEYTKANNKDWHGQHFCCWQCDESLTGQRYVLRDDHPYCVSCYESVFANACEKCSRTIGIDSKDLSYKDKHWHEACFLCTTCAQSLVDKQFGSKGDRIYCGRCYDEQFASRCDGCHEIFRAGTKKMEYKTRQWHEKCFCCCVCKVPIGTQSFIPREQEIYCAKCYEDKYATRCIKCNKVITSGGVTYKNEPWHRECFTCTHCQKSLAGERFTSRDEKPYCADCFGELFAKRCFACNRPITGIGGTKFISFEDRHWHNDCFFCATCRTSLVGRGFITDQEDIICPECAKQKLI
uniref:LIM zinc-binding domain-containing protein n=1 Tax=Dendroctonus ponderosae TaxID=77166 RepID=A0AAR5P7Z5_DENPD